MSTVPESDNESYLVKRLRITRAERPDEWMMDEYIRGVKQLESQLAEARKDMAEVCEIAEENTHVAIQDANLDPNGAPYGIEEYARQLDLVRGMMKKWGEPYKLIAEMEES